MNITFCASSLHFSCALLLAAIRQFVQLHLDGGNKLNFMNGKFINDNSAILITVIGQPNTNIKDSQALRYQRGDARTAAEWLEANGKVNIST